ncbi:MAG: hypothetical protein RLY30_605 [Pseudomonadota bacterium]|jgi:cell division septation protein DedD
MSSPSSALPDGGPIKRPQRPSSSPSPQLKKLGLVPFSLGVATGCILSALLALYVTQSPLPFADKGLRKSSSVSTADPAAPAASEPETPKEAARPEIPAPSSEPLPAASPAKSDKPVEPLGTRYMLQVAAFRSAAEADQMKARLAILGFEASIAKAQREGADVFRVRVGPFDQFEALNQMKAALSDNGVESTVVRVLPE